MRLIVRIDPHRNIDRTTTHLAILDITLIARGCIDQNGDALTAIRTRNSRDASMTPV
jgi:hypothetical protein